MTVHVTYFHAGAQSDGTVTQRNARGVFGAQMGAAEAIEAGGNGGVDDRDRLALIKTTADVRCDVVAGDASADAQSGVWLAGECDVRFVAAGRRISVAAL